MRRRSWLWAALALVAGPQARAHDFRLGELRIDHPYATPSRPGLATGAVYFRGIRNTGTTPDRLLAASTPVATRVEIHRMRMQGDVMQMRALDALDIPAGATVALKHGAPDGHHLMLLDLKAPLREGDRFDLTLTFEKAGSRNVQVWVQTPRDGGSAHQH